MQPEGAPPVERLIVERAVLTPGGIRLSVLNDGPDPVTIAQVTVDDAYWAFTAEENRTELGHLGRTRLDIPYPWVQGEAHFVKVITSTGTVFEHEIAVAVETPKVETRQILAFALIGLYVGVIPVALGLMWFPLVKRLGPTGLDVLLALTIGLLLFLLIDTAHEGVSSASALPESYQGLAVFTAAALGAYLALEAFGSWLKARRSAGVRRGSNGAVLALLIATGIGLHNFGEGLAIGAAFALGEAALGTLLVVGFMLHNTTEGLAIVAPLAKERPSLRQLAWLGFIGGAPTVVGAWVGGLVYSPGARGAVPRPRCRCHRAGAAADWPPDGRHRVHQQAFLFAAGPFGPGGRVSHHARDGHAGRVTTNTHADHQSPRPGLARRPAARRAPACSCRGSSTHVKRSTKSGLPPVSMSFHVEDIAGANPTMALTAGEQVKVTIRNEDRGMLHDFSIPEWGVRTGGVEWGDERSITFRVPATASTLSYICTPHSVMMSGRITVSK